MSVILQTNGFELAMPVVMGVAVWLTLGVMMYNLHRSFISIFMVFIVFPLGVYFWIFTRFSALALFICLAIIVAGITMNYYSKKAIRKKPKK